MIKEDLEQLREVIKAEVEPIKKDVAGIKTSVGYLQTAVEAVKAGLDDVRDKMATEATVMDQGAKIDRITRNHERRIEALEEQAGLTNPHKN